MKLVVCPAVKAVCWQEERAATAMERMRLTESRRRWGKRRRVMGVNGNKFFYKHDKEKKSMRL